MEKVLYISAILIGSLLPNNIFAQTEQRCYSLEKNSYGEVERVFVKLLINGNKVEVNYRKYSTGAAATSHTNVNKLGIIEGDKIIFSPMSGEDNKETITSERRKNDYWFFKEDALIVGEDILKPGDCN